MRIEFERYNFQTGKVEHRVREIDEREILEHNAFAKMLAKKAKRIQGQEG